MGDAALRLAQRPGQLDASLNPSLVCVMYIYNYVHLLRKLGMKLDQTQDLLQTAEPPRI